MEPISLAIFALTSAIGGIIGNQVDDEVFNRFVKNNLKKWLKKTSRPINHDLERAVRKAVLNSTLIFLIEYSKKYTKKFLGIKKRTKELNKIRKYLNAQKKELYNNSYSPPENIVNYELELLLKPNSNGKEFSEIKSEYKNNIINELKNNLEVIPDNFQNCIKEGLTVGSQKMDWFELMSSFFIETVKENKRVRTIVDNELLLSIKRDLKKENISVQFSSDDFKGAITVSEKNIINLLNESKEDIIESINESKEEIKNRINESDNKLINRIEVSDKKLDDDFKQLKKILDLPPEIKEIKEKIIKKTNQLSNTLTELTEIIKNKNQEYDKNKSSTKIKKINWHILMKAIKSGSCILFIGQDLSINENGNSLNEKIFTEFGEQYDIEYLADESFFEPVENVEMQIMIDDIADEFENVFYKNNKIAHKLLQKFAKIPFSLIISMTPDNTMHRIFNEYNKKHQYLSYNGENQNIEKPTNINPIIYNILGEIEKREYLFSHEQFYEYLRNIDIDKNIKLKLKKATHFIFIGFNFNKWYKRLLLFILEITRKSGKSYRHVIDNSNIEDKFKNIIEKQFNLTFINQEYTPFIDQLLQKAKKENQFIDLENDFIKSNVTKIQDINNKLFDESKLEKLTEINKTVEQIENKINVFKNNL